MRANDSNMPTERIGAENEYGYDRMCDSMLASGMEPFTSP